MFCDPFNLFKAIVLGLGSNFFQLPSSCFSKRSLNGLSIQVAEYTLANPPSPICFISVNLLKGTHSRNFRHSLSPLCLASYIVSLMNLSMLEFPLVHPLIILNGSQSLHHNSSVSCLLQWEQL